MSVNVDSAQVVDSKILMSVSKFKFSKKELKVTSLDLSVCVSLDEYNIEMDAQPLY